MGQVGEAQRRYSEQDIERGLVELALAGSNKRLASSRLAERGIDIPPNTLDTWRRETHAERYEDTRRRLLPRIQERIAAEAEDLAQLYADVERATVHAFVGTVDTLQAKDAAGAIRNLATAKAINIDKAQLLRGNPTQIVERRSGEDVLAELRKRLGYDVDGEAEEVGEVAGEARLATRPEPDDKRALPA